MSATVSTRAGCSSPNFKLAPTGGPVLQLKLTPSLKRRIQGRFIQVQCSLGFAGHYTALAWRWCHLPCLWPLFPLAFSPPLSFSPFPVSLVWLSLMFSIHSFPFPRSRKHQNNETNLKAKRSVLGNLALGLHMCACSFSDRCMSCGGASRVLVHYPIRMWTLLSLLSRSRPFVTECMNLRWINTMGLFPPGSVCNYNLELFLIFIKSLVEPNCKSKWQ